MTRYILFFAMILGILGCEPYIEDAIELPAQPAAPDFSMELDPDNPNRVIVKDLSTNSFNRVWEFPGGTPNSSTLAVDTVLYIAAGDYDVTLHIAGEGGGGTNSATKSLNIEQDAEVECTDFLTLLTGGCNNPDGKCWTFISAAGAVTVGPVPGSGEWFTSPIDGLQAEQYDDSFCFYFEGFSFLYENNGATVNPWNGFAPEEYDPPTDHTWTLVEGGGENGENRLLLTEGSFMGLWDAGPVVDIIVLTEDELVIRSPFLDGGGWFELYFEPN